MLTKNSVWINYSVKAEPILAGTSIDKKDHLRANGNGTSDLPQVFLNERNLMVQ